MTRPPLVIVVKGWPRLSETFIAQELVALEERGIDFELWSLRRPTDTQTHPLHDRLRARVVYLPEYLRDEPWRVLRAALSVKFWRVLPQVLRDLVRDPTRNRVRRFGQALVLAAEGPPHLRGLYAHFLHTPASVARYAAMLRGVPWSFSAHAKDIWTSPDWDLRDKLGGPSAAQFGATCTAYGAERLRQLSEQTPVDLIYHGLDLKRFPEPPDRAHRPEARLLSVGRLVEKKGFDRLLDALALLPPEIDWHWHHIGGGALSETLKAQANRLGLDGRITWHGALSQPDVISAMRDANLFILPSRIASDGDRDGLPNVLMEAASQKLPILATPVAAIPEFITHDTHGLLSDDAPDSLAAQITRVIREPGLGRRLADAAYTRLTQGFLMKPGIDRLSQQLSDMLDEAS